MKVVLLCGGLGMRLRESKQDRGVCGLNFQRRFELTNRVRETCSRKFNIDKRLRITRFCLQQSDFRIEHIGNNRQALLEPGIKDPAVFFGLCNTALCHCDPLPRAKQVQIVARHIRRNVVFQLSETIFHPGEICPGLVGLMNRRPPVPHVERHREDLAGERRVGQRAQQFLDNISDVALRAARPLCCS